MSQRMEEPGSPRALRNKRVFIYSWRQFEKRTHALLAALAKAGISNVELVPLLESPDHMLPLLTEKGMRFPLVSMDGVLLSFDSEDLLSRLREGPAVSDQEAVCHVSLPEKPEFLYSTPQVEYLDKSWGWAALVFNVIETFGCSVGKSADDPLLPEEFLIDCLRRNVEVESPSDCRLLIFELTNAGIIEETKYQEYKLTYHRSLHGLNCNRDPFDGTIQVPSAAELMTHLVAVMARVRRLHSVEYLEFVDATHFFRLLRFADILKIGNRKLLVDMYVTMAAQISLLGALVESEREKFYYEFADKKVHSSQIKDEVLKATPAAQREAVKCLLYLGWTLTGDEAKDVKILELAVKSFSHESVVVQNGKSFAPAFLTLPSRAAKYDIHISPCLSL